jgi:hypothetical protein
MHAHLFRNAVVVTFALFIGATAAIAGTTSAAVLAGEAASSNFIYPVGWAFRANVTMQVDELGIYEYGGAPGLDSFHNVGIFGAGGALVTATVPAGTVGTLVGNSRFIPVTPVTLDAGGYYYIVADNFQFVDAYVYGPGVLFDPQITWMGAGETDGTIFSSFTNIMGEPGNLGPNFRFTAVPEPSGLALIGLTAPALLRRPRANVPAKLA